MPSTLMNGDNFHHPRRSGQGPTGPTLPMIHSFAPFAPLITPSPFLPQSPRTAPPLHSLITPSPTLSQQTHGQPMPPPPSHNPPWSQPLQPRRHRSPYLLPPTIRPITEPLSTLRQTKDYYTSLLTAPHPHPRLQELRQQIQRIQQTHLPPFPQPASSNNNSPLEATGVIYFKGRLDSKKGYVGKALYPLDRDRTHHRNALNRQPDAPCLSRAIRRSHPSCDPIRGKWFLVILEQIDPQFWQPESRSSQRWASRVQHFNRVALAREQFWIRHLKTGQPRGWNVSINYRNRHLRRSQHRPTPHQRPGPPSPHSGIGHWWTVHNGQVTIDLSPGQFAHRRRQIHRLLSIPHGARPTALPYFHPTTLRRLLYLMEQIPHPTRLLPPLPQLCTDIRTALSHIRWVPRRVPSQVDRDILKILYKRRDLHSARLAHILHHPDIIRLHPFPDEAANILLCTKLNIPVQLTLCNYPQVARSTSLTADYSNALTHPETCPCQQYRHSQGARLVDGHVILTDLTALDDPHLNFLHQYGRRFRLSDQPGSALDAINDALGFYVERKIRQLGHSVQEQLSHWAEAILTQCAANLREAGADIAEPHFRTTTWRRTLRRFHRHMVTAPVDKTTHNIAHGCKAWYQWRLQQALQHRTFEPSPIPSDAVLHEHQTFNAAHRLQHTPQHHYLYLAWKLHKEPIDVRTISGTAMYDRPSDRLRARNTRPTQSTTSAEKRLDKLLRASCSVLQDKDRAFYNSTGLRRFWIINSTEEFTVPMKQDEAGYANANMQTFDCANMYTELDHGTLRRHVLQAITEASIFLRRRADSPDSHVWVQDNDGTINMTTQRRFHHREEHPNLTCYNQRDVEELLDFVLDNAYIHNNPEDPPRRQVIGIPMGSCVAVTLANLYCYIPESQYVDNLATNDMPAAVSLSRCKRLIDDLFWTGQHPPHEGFYPHLQLNPTTRPDGTITFIGVDITRHSDGGLIMSTHNKEDDLHIPIIRYPHADTNAPRHQIQGVFTGQVIRAKVVCNRLWTFRSTVTEILSRLLSRGYPLHRFFGPWHRFLRNYWTTREVQVLQLEQMFHSVCRQLSNHPPRTHPTPR